MAKIVKLPEKTPIPSNWIWVELGELSSTKSGYPFDSKRFSGNQEGKRPIIRIRDVVRGYTETYTDEDCPEDYIISKGKILIGMDGDFNLEKWNNGEALLNQRVCCIQSESELLLNDFIYFYLPIPLKMINEATPSVTVKHLSTKTIAKIPFPLPPLAEQRRIVDRIESLFARLDEAKEKAQAVVDGFELRRSAILHKAFTGELTEQWRKEHGVGLDSWAKRKLKDCGAWHGGGTPSMAHPEYWDGGNLLWITSKDMKSDVIEDTLMYTNMVGVENSSANYIEKPSVLFVMRSGILRRTLPIAMVKIPFTVNQDLKAISPVNDLDLDYFFWACKSAEKRILGSCMKNGTTVESINAKALMEFGIPVASQPEQREIVNCIANLLEKEQQAKEAAEAVLAQIDTMKKAILARAFRGELGTNDPPEEWAGGIV